eukprot:2232906-Prymnesium_polylepis.1
MPAAGHAWMCRRAAPAWPPRDGCVRTNKGAWPLDIGACTRRFYRVADLSCAQCAVNTTDRPTPAAH